MDSLGLAIILLTLSCFVGIFIYLLLFGFKDKLPEGYTKTFSYDNIKLKIVWADAYKPLPLFIEKNCLNCIVTLTNVLKDLRSSNIFYENLSKHINSLREVNIVLLNNGSYLQVEKDNGLEPGGSNAFTINTPRMIGHGPPLFYVKSEFIYTPSLYSLIIHESIHVLASKAKLSLKQNYYHQESLLWKRPAEFGSLELLTQKQFFENVEQKE